MAGRGGVVVVAGRDTDRLDEVAGRLRERYTVRVCYSTSDLDARIDEQTDVVLVIGDGPLECSASSGLPQVGRVGAPALPDADASLGRPATDAAIESLVDRLETRASYLRSLETSYSVARRRADSESDEPTGPLAEYREEVAAAMDRLSAEAAFELLGTEPGDARS